MNTVTLTSKFQLDFPQNISETYGLEAGDTFEFIPYNNRIELIPLKPIKKMKGIFRGIDTNIIRENDRI
ncbi:MAG: AbrB/MazE/SpoVT family DNA-binding domain-containing protein [Treponema sp.]|nr:AbrB/MazE/SpoVT family DNA-binding domain-containing protein [Treponema sp.]